MGERVVFVGVATLDSIALVPHYPGADERVVATEIATAGGGPAATAAVTAARQGVAAAFVGTVGADADGEQVVAGLEAEGVDVSAVVVDPSARTGRSVVVVDHATSSRAISNLPAPAPLLCAPARRLLADAAWVHADHVGWPALVAADLPARGWRLSVDAGYPIPGLTPVGVDLYAPTLAALASRLGRPESDVDGLLSAVLAEGAGAVVVTAGPAGSYAATAAGERHHAPAVPVEVVSTLGAGDVFHGALVAAYALGLPLAHALRYANTVAALSCRGLDGRGAIPRRDEVQRLLAHPFDRPADRPADHPADHPADRQADSPAEPGPTTPPDPTPGRIS